MDKIITAIIGFITGAAGSLVAPWIHWGIEKRRDKRANRKELVAQARQYICSNSLSGFSFSEEALFIRLKPYLKKSVVEWVERYDHFHESIDDTSSFHEDFKVELLKELQEIEKKWGLI